MKGYPLKSIVLASLIALLVAWLQPSLFMTSMMFCIAPVAIAALYAWGGWIPAGIVSIGTVGSLAYTASVGGSVSHALAGLGAAVVLVLPGIVSICLMEKRLPFFRRMLISIGVQIAALLGCVSVIYLGMGIDLADGIAAFLRTGMEILPHEMQMSMLQMYANYGMLTEESIIELTSGIVLPSDIVKVFDQVFELVGYQLRQTLPAMLLGSGLLTGVVMTALSSRIAVRRGVQPVVPHVPVYGWFMPAHLVGGVTICLASGLVMQLMKIDEALAVTAVFSLTVSYLSMIQGVAAISRRFREAGASKFMRRMILITGVLFASWFVETYGMLSALFGRKGAISTWWIRKMKEMEENRKDDDDL